MANAFGTWHNGEIGQCDAPSAEMRGSSQVRTEDVSSCQVSTGTLYKNDMQ